MIFYLYFHHNIVFIIIVFIDSTPRCIFCRTAEDCPSGYECDQNKKCPKYSQWENEEREVPGSGTCSKKGKYT